MGQSAEGGINPVGLEKFESCLSDCLREYSLARHSRSEVKAHSQSAGGSTHVHEVHRCQAPHTREIDPRIAQRAFGSGFKGGCAAAAQLHPSGILGHATRSYLEAMTVAL